MEREKKDREKGIDKMESQKEKGNEEEGSEEEDDVVFQGAFVGSKIEEKEEERGGEKGFPVGISEWMQKLVLMFSSLERSIRQSKLFSEQVLNGMPRGDLVQSLVQLLKICHQLYEGSLPIACPLPTGNEEGKESGKEAKKNIPWRLACDLSVLSPDLLSLEKQHLSLARVAAHTISSLLPPRAPNPRLRSFAKSLLEEAVGEERYLVWFKERKARLIAQCQAVSGAPEGEIEKACGELREYVCDYVWDVVYPICRGLGLLWGVWGVQGGKLMQVEDDLFLGWVERDVYPFSVLEKGRLWENPLVSFLFCFFIYFLFIFYLFFIYFLFIFYLFWFILFLVHFVFFYFLTIPLSLDCARIPPSPFLCE